MIHRKEKVSWLVWTFTIQYVSLDTPLIKRKHSSLSFQQRKVCWKGEERPRNEERFCQAVEDIDDKVVIGDRVDIRTRELVIYQNPLHKQQATRSIRRKWLWAAYWDEGFDNEGMKVKCIFRDGEGANLLSDSKRVDDAISHVPSFEPIRVIALDDEEGGCDGGKEDRQHSRRSRRWHSGEVGKKGEERGKLADDECEVYELEEENGDGGASKVGLLLYDNWTLS